MVLGGVLLCGTLALAAPAARAEEWQRLVGVLQYLEGDYPAAVASQDAFELAEQRAFVADAVATARGLGPDAAMYVERLLALQKHIDDGRDADVVSRDSGALAREMTLSAGLQRRPRHAPDFASAQKLWAQSCAVCHGANGDGETPFKQTLKPPPANFTEAQVLAGLSPFRAYNTLSSGIPGTAMPSFPTLTEDERWSLAFYLFTFSRPACTTPLPHATLEALAIQSDEELTQHYGAKAVDCLRSTPPAESVAVDLAAAVERIEHVRREAKTANPDAVRAALVDAYLQGFEPLEPLLRSRAPDAVAKVEHDFLQARQVTHDPKQLDAALASLSANLEQLGSKEAPRADFWSVFLSALLILVREGFEAAVVVGALLAVLKKVGATEQARTVHWGWVTALGAGIIGFAIGHRALSGAHRESLETMVGFVAVVMLAYAALWLNARSNISQYMGELREKMKGALGTGSTWGLFAIAFTAVARETFETALFLQGLATDSLSGAVYGGLAGLVALTVLFAIIRRAGFILPMKTLFNASTVLLLFTAVMILGKSMHGLIELGQLDPAPLPFFSVPALGIFADAWSLVPQALLVLVPSVMWAWRRRRHPPKFTRPATSET
ncbi:MAG: FTR1 family protein [Myxococcaceae bacterium]|nr:FTR1 family protein [Myxococcaceae bacterium]